MIKNDLAKQINWKGKGDKIAFSTLKLKDLLISKFQEVYACGLFNYSRGHKLNVDKILFQNKKDNIADKYVLVLVHCNLYHLLPMFEPIIGSKCI